jgi:hypothetical protein
VEQVPLWELHRELIVAADAQVDLDGRRGKAPRTHHFAKSAGSVHALITRRQVPVRRA